MLAFLLNTECGLQFASSNAKINEGIEAQPSSWPSIALIKFNYTFNYQISGSDYTAYKVSYCGGVLIDRQTVLTASSCFIENIKITHYALVINLKVELNRYHSNIESMYTVFVGIHNKSSVYTGAALSISNFVRVRKSFFKVLAKFFIYF